MILKRLMSYSVASDRYLGIKILGDQRYDSPKFPLFYARTQDQNESITDYSHALVRLLDQVTLKDETERDTIF